jgi:hypothetical protein
MKIEMKLLTTTYNDDEFNNAVAELEKSRWKLKRQYGGTLSKYKGHGAEMEKFCFSCDGQRPKLTIKDLKQ